MAVDFLASSSVPTKSAIFWVMMICIPLYLRIRFASWYIKSRAMGNLLSINTCASSITTITFLWAP